MWQLLSRLPGNIPYRKQSSSSNIPITILGSNHQRTIVPQPQKAKMLAVKLLKKTDCFFFFPPKINNNRDSIFGRCGCCCPFVGFPRNCRIVIATVCLRGILVYSMQKCILIPRNILPLIVAHFFGSSSSVKLALTIIAWTMTQTTQ